MKSQEKFKVNWKKFTKAALKHLLNDYHSQSSAYLIIQPSLLWLSIVESAANGEYYFVSLLKLAIFRDQGHIREVVAVRDASQRKGPATLKALVKLWRICVVGVLLSHQMNSKVDHSPHANWDWWKYIFYAITLVIYGWKWPSFDHFLAIFGLFLQIFYSTDYIYAYFKLEMHQ